MRPLPRLLAVTTDAVCRSPDFANRAASIGGAGPRVALVVRAPGVSAAEHAAFSERAAMVAGAAALFVHARPDLARAVGAAGVQLRRCDLAARDARGVLGAGWIGVSVHGREEAEAAIEEGADFVVAGAIFETGTHPERPPRGLAWLEDLCSVGRPVIAIGGITPERAPAVRDAGAWGAAAISALWEAGDPGVAATGILSAWDTGG